MVVLLIEFFLQERHLRSTGTFESVRLGEVSVLWDVRLKRFYCSLFILQCSYTKKCQLRGCAETICGNENRQLIR